MSNHLSDKCDGRGCVLGHDGIHHSTHQFVRNGPEHIFHVVLGNRFATECHGLIQQTEGITHTALTRSGYHSQASFADRDADAFHDFLKTGNDLSTGNPPKVEMLTSRSNGRGNLMDFSRRKDKHRVLRGLFQGFQQRVKRGIGEHVHFIDDGDSIGASEGRKFDVFPKLPDIVDPGI